MDATTSDKQEAQLATDGASVASVPELRRGPLCETVVAGGSGAAEGSGGGEDEQVERFYALLANIRALRNVYGGAGGSSSRKRARGAEPPWRPRFRMEDFRVVDDAVVSAAKKERRDRGEGRRSESDDATDHDGEVVEENENDRVSASQSTRACADSV